MGVGGTRLGVGCILLEDIRLEVGCILLEGLRLGLGGTHLVLGCILLEGILLDPGLFRDLVDLLRVREGLLGQARSTLPVRVSSLLGVVLRGPAVVSILQGLVHQVLTDRAQTDQGRTARVLMDQVPTVLVPMDQAQMDQVLMAQARTDQVPMGLAPMDQAQTVQAQTDLIPMDLVQMSQVQMVQAQMVLVRMAQARMKQVRMAQGPTVQVRMDQVPMDLVQAAGRLGVEATAKSQRSSLPRDTSAQLRLHLHHAPLHLKPSWQNAMRQSLSLEDRIAHFAILARFALSPQRTLCKYQSLIRSVENKPANIFFPAPAQAPQQSRSPTPQPQAPSITATPQQL